MGDRIDRLFRMVQKKTDNDAPTNQLNQLSKSIDDKLKTLGDSLGTLTADGKIAEHRVTELQTRFDALQTKAFPMEEFIVDNQKHLDHLCSDANDRSSALETETKNISQRLSSQNFRLHAQIRQLKGRSDELRDELKLEQEDHVRAREIEALDTRVQEQDRLQAIEFENIVNKHVDKSSPALTAQAGIVQSPVVGSGGVVSPTLAMTYGDGYHSGTAAQANTQQPLGGTQSTGLLMQATHPAAGAPPPPPPPPGCGGLFGFQQDSLYTNRDHHGRGMPPAGPPDGGPPGGDPHSGIGQVAWNGHVFNLNEWNIDLHKIPASIPNFNGINEGYRNWKMQIENLLASANQNWVPLLQEIAQQQTAIDQRSFMPSASCQGLTGPNLKMLSDTLWGILSYTLGDVYTERLKAMAGGMLRNGFGIWRQRFSFMGAARLSIRFVACEH